MCGRSIMQRIIGWPSRPVKGGILRTRPAQRPGFPVGAVKAAFCGAHVPGSLNIPEGMVAAYAGWLLPYDRDLLLVLPADAKIPEAILSFVRTGYDRLAGYLAGGVHGWEIAGKPFETVPAVTARELTESLDGADTPVVLDVRKIDEYEAGHLPEARHVFLGHLPDNLDEIPRDATIVTFCGSGRRASIAASVLRRAGFEDVATNLGSMAACQTAGCPIAEG